MSKPFSRFAALMAIVTQMMSAQNISMAAAVIKTGGYKSRGKGKTSRPSGTAGGKFPGSKRQGITYPERSLRQENMSFRRARGGPGLDANNQPRVS